MDDSKHPEAAVRFLETLRLRESARLVVLTLVEPARTVYGVGEAIAGPELYRLAEEWAAAQELEAATYAAGVGARLGGSGIPTEVVVRTGHPAAEVLKVAAEQEIDLIVTGARRLPPVLARLFGSVSRAVCRHASCPVLVVKGRAGEPLIPAGRPRRILLAASLDPSRTFATHLPVCVDS